MDTLVIEQSRSLKGVVDISGAKNAALPIMAACLLTDEECVIERVPRVTDVETMNRVLEHLGLEVTTRDRTLTIRSGSTRTWDAPYALVHSMRASICLLGPLLARYGRARVSMPGGCIIGPRPIDLHLAGLRALGAQITTDHGDLVAQASRLVGATIHLAGSFGSSVLATANVMMAASLAQGVTVIEHAACEPEVVDLAQCLIAMGAKISGHGTSSMRIEGVPTLHGVRHRIIPDRIEAGTLMIATAMLGGDVRLEGARAEHLGAVIETLTRANVRIDSPNGCLRVRSDRHVNAVHVTTQPFPGFPTDLQAQIMAMAAISRGVSVITERIYPERFLHVPELCRMGAQISREGSHALVTGVERLGGASVMATDLRASAALVLAGLTADDRTELNGLEHLDRGYERLEQKLAQLGARITRTNHG